MNPLEKIQQDMKMQDAEVPQVFADACVGTDDDRVCLCWLNDYYGTVYFSDALFTWN